MTSLKQKVQQDKKYFTESQIYIVAFNLLKNKISLNVNKNMSRDYKIEFGYLFVGYLRDFIKDFCKLYRNKDYNFYNKEELFKNIENNIENIDIMIEILLSLKKDDKYNWVGFTENQLLDIKKDWGNILSQYENYTNWINKNAN